MPRKARSFAVIGLGTFGSTIASELARFGNYVLGLDIDERRVNPLVDTLSQAVIADGRDEGAMREAGVDQCEVAIVAIGEDLEANILCVMNAKLIGAKTVWGKAKSRTHHRILTKLGVDRVVHPEEEMGRHISQVLNNPLVRDYVSLGNGFHVVHMIIPEHLRGKKLNSLKLAERFEIRCLGGMRGSEFIAGDNGDLMLEADDKLLMLGRRINLRKFSDSL